MSKSKNETTWMEVVAHSDSLGKHVVEVQEGQRYTVRGPVHDVMILSIPQNDLHSMVKSGQFDATMEAIATVVPGGGFEGGILLLPEGVKYMKLEPVDKLTAKLLENKNQREKIEYQRRIEQIKKEQEDGGKSDIFDIDEHPIGSVENLNPDTKTVGEA